MAVLYRKNKMPFKDNTYSVQISIIVRSRLDYYCLSEEERRKILKQTTPSTSLLALSVVLNIPMFVLVLRTFFY